MKTYPEIIQSTPEWFALRLGKITASNFSDAVAGGTGKTRKTRMKKLAFEQLNNIPFPEKFKGNSSMEWGNETEDEARNAFTTKTGLVVDQVGFIEYDDDIGYSPDGLIGEDGLLEIKCPDTLTHMDYCDGGTLPKAYRDQMQGGMMVTDRKYCWFVSYDPRHLIEPLHKRLIRRNEKDIKELRIGLVMFVNELKELTERLTPKPLF